MADQEYVYEAEVVRLVDGDTVRLKLSKAFTFNVDFGFYIKEQVMTVKSTEMNFRLRGIDTPELRGVPLEIKEQGLAAKAELGRLLSLGKIQAFTYKPDKYGRWLVTLWVSPADGSEKFNVNDKLVEDGFAKPYMR
jgi:endonuclease YncB( thermonuclease family)